MYQAIIREGGRACGGARGGFGILPDRFGTRPPRVARRTRARVTTRGGPGVEVWLVRWSYTLWRVRVSAGASGTRGTVSALSRGWFQLLPSRQRAAASSSFGALVGDGGASISSSLSGPRN